MTSHHLAQLNIAQMRAPLDNPSMADFANAIGRVNALADQAPGFIWRFDEESGAADGADDNQSAPDAAIAIRLFGADYVVNMSVWTDVESLRDYAFKSAHSDILRRRREWFHRMTEAHAVLWWVPAGHRPSLAEAKHRLDHLRAHGPGPLAFTFTQWYPALNIRAAALADVDTLTDLMRAYWAFEEIAGFDPAQARRQLELFLSTPTMGRGWIAERAGIALGYLLCPFVYSFEQGGLLAEIDEFFVEEAARSHGVGRALLETARAALIECGCVALQLQVAADNESAQRFYARWGFKPALKYPLWVAPLGATG